MHLKHAAALRTVAEKNAKCDATAEGKGAAGRIA